MDAAQTHLASCYAHSGPILDTGCHYGPTIYITRPKMCLGRSKMCPVTTRHTFNEQMGKWAAREKQEVPWQIATCLRLTSTWHELEFSKRIFSPLLTDKIFFTSQKSGIPNVQESVNNFILRKDIRSPKFDGLGACGPQTLHN